MGKATDYRYAWRNGPRWSLWYLQRGRILATLRVLWHSLVRGDIGEACELCGRPYLLWHADDNMYASVTGDGPQKNGQSAPGLYCPECFDKMARKNGIKIYWKPLPFPWWSE